MHQNSSIVYHIESITEMQLIGLVMCYTLHNQLKGQLNYGAAIAKDAEAMSLGMNMESASLLIFLLMLVQGILFWIVSLIKEFNVKKYGQADDYGIESTFCSVVLDQVLFFITGTIFVLSVIHLVALGDKRHDIPFISYYIIVNMCMMLL